MFDMKPRVLLVVLPYVVKNIDANRPKVRSFSAFPYGVLSMASYCKDLAEIEILDLNTIKDETIPPEDYVEVAVRRTQPHIVGFSMMFDTSYHCLGACLKKVKGAFPFILTLLGGAAASYSYAEIMAGQPDLDALCFSEGEEPMRDLLEAFGRGEDIRAMRKVGNAWVLRDTISGFPPQPQFIQDLDRVIDLDYSMVDVEAYGMAEAFSPYARENRKCFFLMTSRGCFGKCAFCSNGAIHGKKVRQASVPALIAHVRKLVDDYGMETLIIYDDQLLYHKDRAKEFFRQLAQFHIRVEAPNGVSVAFMDEEMAGLMRMAGFDTVYLAVESGSEYVLKNLIHKPLKLHMVSPVVRWLQDVGIFVHAFIVLGMPGETDAHRRETEQFLLHAGVNWAGINLATPVRGSQLYDDCIKNGWIQKQRIGDIVDKKYVIEVPGVDPEEVTRQAYDMNLNINFRNNLDMSRRNYGRAAACFREVLRRYSGHKLAKEYLASCEERMKR